MQMNTNKDGKLSKEEYAAGMRKANPKLNMTEEMINELFDAIDTDKSGKISYSEFIKAAMNKSSLMSLSKLIEAFNYFDV